MPILWAVMTAIVITFGSVLFITVHLRDVACSDVTGCFLDQKVAGPEMTVFGGRVPDRSDDAPSRSRKRRCASWPSSDSAVC